METVQSIFSKILRKTVNTENNPCLKIPYHLGTSKQNSEESEREKVQKQSEPWLISGTYCGLKR